MPQQKLNLFEFSAGCLTETRTSAPEVMGRNTGYSNSFSRIPYNVPDGLDRDSFSPGASASSHPTEDSAFHNARGCDALTNPSEVPSSKRMTGNTYISVW